MTLIQALAIRDYREKYGFTVRELAKIIGVEHTALWRFERGAEVRNKASNKIILWLIAGVHTEKTNNKTITLQGVPFADAVKAVEGLQAKQ